jgi:hypothetical protein
LLGAHIEQLDAAVGQEALQLRDRDLAHLRWLVGIVDLEAALAALQEVDRQAIGAAGALAIEQQRQAAGLDLEVAVLGLVDGERVLELRRDLDAQAAGVALARRLDGALGCGADAHRGQLDLGLLLPSTS